MEYHNNSAAIWAIFTKFGVVVDMDSLQRAVTTIFDLYKNSRCRPAAILKKENHHISAVVSDIFTKFCVLLDIGIPHRPLVLFLDYNKIQDGGRRHFEKAENRKILTAIWDVFTNSLVKPQILFIKKLQAIYLMLYKRYKTAKIKKYKHKHYELA